MPKRSVMRGVAPGWPQRVLLGFLAVIWVVLGLAFGAVFLGLGAAAALGLAARIWWLKRRSRRERRNRHATVIEGEYRVLEKGTDDGTGGSHA